MVGLVKIFSIYLFSGIGMGGVERKYYESDAPHRQSRTIKKAFVSKAHNLNQPAKGKLLVNRCISIWHFFSSEDGHHSRRFIGQNLFRRLKN
jgi:hypothetical protein